MSKTAPVYFRNISLMDELKYALLWPYSTIVGADYMGLAVGAGYMYYMGTLQFAGVPWSQLAMNVAMAGGVVFAYEYAMNGVIDHVAIVGSPLALVPGKQTPAASVAPAMHYAPGPIIGGM